MPYKEKIADDSSVHFEMIQDILGLDVDRLTAFAMLTAILGLIDAIWREAELIPLLVAASFTFILTEENTYVSLEEDALFHFTSEKLRPSRKKMTSNGT